MTWDYIGLTESQHFENYPFTNISEKTFIGLYTQIWGVDHTQVWWIGFPIKDMTWDYIGGHRATAFRKLSLYKHFSKNIYRIIYSNLGCGSCSSMVDWFPNQGHAMGLYLRSLSTSISKIIPLETFQ